MYILKDGDYVKIESTEYEKTESGREAIALVVESMNMGLLRNENCVIALGDEKVMVKVGDFPDSEMRGIEDYKGEVCSRSDNYEIGQVVSFSLDDVIDVFPPIHSGEE